jgi:diguanylate cyclase (GGDEF)-like protein/PAS domain S-box-containing protein
LEAGATRDDPALPDGARERLLQTLSDYEPAIVCGERRCSVQLQVEAANEAEALFAASARWRDAAHRLGLAVWPVVRAEVLTREEFLRDGLESTDPLAPIARGAASATAGTRFGAAEDLLPRALQDSLTGLVNRELFADCVRSVLADDPGAGDHWAVLVFDVDAFGAVNQAEGPALGDRLLAVLGSRISRVPEHTMVARLGGDEFAALVRVAPANTIDQIAARLLETIRAPVEVGRRRVTITASVGVATSANMTHPDDLIRDAAIAMCIAKADGGDCWRPFDPDVSVDLKRLDFDTDPAPDRLAYVLLLERAALAANECQSLEEAASIVLQEVCAHTGWRLGRLTVTAKNGGAQPAVVWHTRGADHFEAFRAGCDARLDQHEEALAARVLQSRRSVSVADLVRDPDLPACLLAAAAEAGIKSGVASPILLEGDVVAVLEFYSSRPGRINDALHEVLRGVCAQLGRIVERNRAEAALRDSESRLRALVATSGTVITVVDADNTVLADYPGAWDEMGYPEGAAAGQKGFDFVHPDDLAGTIEAFAAARGRPGFSEPFELRVRHANGPWRWVVAIANNLLDYPPVHGIVISSVDITDRKAMEAALAKVEDQLRRAEEGPPPGLWHWDPVSGDVRWSEEMYEIFGVTPGTGPAPREIAGSAIHLADRGRVTEAIGSLGAARQSGSVEYRIIRPNGEIRRVRGRAMAVRSDTGAHEVITGCLQDITELVGVEVEVGSTGAA